MLPVYQPNEAEAYFQSKNLRFRRSGDELVLEHCPWCSGEWKAYVNNQSGLFSCKRGSCAKSANFWQIKKHFGDVTTDPSAGLKEKKTHTLADFSPFEAALAVDTDVQAYLAGRGLTLETAQAWHFGLKTDRDGVRWLMMPYVRGHEVLDVKYRSLPPTDKRFKRLGGGESILYGQQTMDALRKAEDRPLYLTEAELDCVTLWQHGFQPCIATTTGAGAFNPAWYDAIQDYAPTKIYICYDSDAAGQNGADRHLKKFEADGREVVNIVLPTKDVNEFFQSQTVAEFQALLDAAKPQEIENAKHISSVIDLLEEQLWYSANSFDGQPSQFECLNTMIAGGYWNGQLVTLSAPSGCGKALSVDTKIPTANRGFVSMGDIAVGDTVLDEHGKPCNVTYVSPIQHRDTYDVAFSDGSIVTACGDHLWHTKTAQNRDAGQPGSTKTTQQIADTLRCWNNGRQTHSVDVCGAWELPHADLPLDPYVLGAWLGDGTRTNGGFTCADPEIVEHIKSAGFVVKKLDNKASYGSYAWRIMKLAPILYKLDAKDVSLERVGRGRARCLECKRVRWMSGRGLCWTCGPNVRAKYPKRLNGKATRFKDGVLHRKRVPQQYLWASREQRLALLQGLMDTDGSCRPSGACEFSNSVKEISDAVYHLAVSLGIKPWRRTKKTHLNGKQHKDSYVVAFTTTVPVFRLQRKLARIPTTVRNTQRYRYITAVTPRPSVPLKCISVDSPSQLYLCGEAGIPTHNTTLVLTELLWQAKKGSPAFLYCLEMPVTMMLRKIISKEFDVPMLKITQAHITEYRPTLSKLPFYMGDKAGDLDDIERTIRTAHKRYDLGCIAFDNLNYFVRSVDNNEQEIARVTKRMKQLAVELHVPIILIAQPRKFDDESRAMTKADLKGSSAIEADSDTIVLLHRRRIKTEVKNFGKDTRGFVGNQSPYTLVRVDKARYCAGGETYLYLDGARSTYRELTPGEHADGAIRES